MANDPWDDEAAKFKASGSTATAPEHDEEDYSVWNKTKGGDSSDQRQGWRDRFIAGIGAPEMTPDPENTGKGQLERFGQRTAKNLATMALHPIDTAVSAIKPSSASTPQEIQNELHGDVDTVKDYAQHPANLAGDAASGLIGGALFHGANKAVSSGSRFARNFRPASAPNVVSPEETAARDLTNAINPEPKRAPSYIQAAQQEVPNILDYAKRTNNPLRTQLEFSKAAEGYAQEARSHYEDNILGPNGNHKVPVPSGSQVQALPAGENLQNRVTTLRNVDKRIVDINKELNSPRLNATDARSALAPDADLLAEKANLTDILHRSLSDLTGIAPEDVADLRQRVGRARELANDTNAAVTARGLKEGQPASIGGLPTGLGDVAMRGVNAARGGPTAITDRAFQKAIQNFPGQSKPLPQVTGPKPVVSNPAPRSAFARPAPVELPTVNTADPAAQAAARNTNLSRFRSTQAAQQAAADAERASMLRQQQGAAGNRSLTHEERMQNAQRNRLANQPDEPGGDPAANVQPEKHTFDGKSTVAASVPTEVTDLLHRTGAKITNHEAPTSKVVASVDPDEPNNINIDDKERYSKDKNAANQTLSHEAVHVWHNNLPPEIQKMIPMDDPKDPYHKNGYEPDELQNMRAQGLKGYNLPRERFATVIQKYSHLGGSNAPKEVRDVYEPWAKDLTDTALSVAMPTSRNQQGINTDMRPPGSAPMPETTIFPEEKSEEKKEKSDSAKEEKAEKHGAGDTVGYDSEDGLPIIKRKSAETKPAKAETKPAESETKAETKEKPSAKAETEHKYGNTQANIPPESDAHKAIKGMQGKIPDEHLHGDGKDIDEPHVTVRYGVQGDTAKLKDYLSKQAPFDAKLGKTTSFPPSEHSNGASPIVAPIESEDLHRMNGEIQKHADFAPSNFPDYKPHATVAYVHPDHAAKYVGMKDGEGKTFKVGSVSISDRDGNKEDVKLGGSKDVPAPKSNPKGDGSSEQAKPPEKSGGESFKVGDRVTLPDGKTGTVAYVPGKNSQLPTYRFKVDGGKTVELRASQMGKVKPAEEDGKTPPPGHTTVTTHFRRLPGKTT